jgi:putative aldouronate transport system substrate-binding protein
MRKLTYQLLLLATLLAAILTACGTPPAATGGDTGAVGASAAPSADNAVASAAADTSAPSAAASVAADTSAPSAAASGDTAGAPVDLEMWVSAAVSEAGPPPDDWAVYQIARDKLGINLKVVILPSDFSDQDAKINAAAAANTLPDFFYANRDTWYRLVETGLVAPVDELLPQMPNRTKTHYSDELRNKLATVNGKMYGLPEPGALPHTDGLVIRKDWLDKLGLQAPKTPEEFLAVAKAFTEQDPDGNGQNDTYGFGAFIESPGISSMGLGPRFDFLYGAYGVAGAFNVSGAEQFGLNVRNPNFLKATEFIKSLNDAKVIDPDWPTLKKDEFRARWKQGKYGIMLENFAALSTKANYKDFDANFPAGEWIAIAPPVGPDGQSSEGLTYQSVRMHGVSQAALDAGKGPAIAKLLEWMASDEGYYLVGFGQEGVNFKRDASGFVSTEGLAPEQAWNSKEAQPLTQLRNLVYVNNEVELKARYVPHKTQNGRTIDPLSYYAAFGEQPYTEATGATIITPPANGADFTRFYGENLVNFVLGQQPLDQASWDGFIQGLDGLGARDLEASAKQTLTEAGFLK